MGYIDWKAVIHCVYYGAFGEPAIEGAAQIDGGPLVTQACLLRLLPADLKELQADGEEQAQIAVNQPAVQTMWVTQGYFRGSGPEEKFGKEKEHEALGKNGNQTQEHCFGFM